MRDTKKYQPVEDNPGWFRDSNGAIVRIDTKARNIYKKRKEQINKRKQAELDRDERLTTVEGKLDKLTDMLEKVLEGREE